MILSVNTLYSPEVLCAGSASVLLAYIKITVFGFALSAFWGSLHAIIMLLWALAFVSETLKNTYLDFLVLTDLILEMAVQPIVGVIGDRSGFSWGRRRPYILLGS